MVTKRRSLLALSAAMTLGLAACGDDGGAGSADSGATAVDPASSARQKSDLEHIHGLGIDPASGELLVATHFGLFHAAKGQTQLERMGPSRQDIMGFSVVGPDKFIGSGHPDPSQNQPPNLGLIESDNAGQSWRNVSLLGEADFHVLRSARKQVYGFNGVAGALMVSDDGGQTWTKRTPPGGIFDLAIDPADIGHVVTSTDQGLFTSQDAGETWRPLPVKVAGLLTWPDAKGLFLVDGQGQVSRSADAGRSFNVAGTIGGPPAAFTSQGGALYAALGDGNVVGSTDAGTSWEVRATP